MDHVEQLSASLEDYLEAIFHIISKKGGVRAKDIAKHLDVKASSVTAALQTLAKLEHINYRPYEVISLTPKGLVQAKEIVRKHEVLKEFFIDILGAQHDVAEEGACKMEHVISEELLSRVINFTEFVQACPRCDQDMIERFQRYYHRTPANDSGQCSSCIINDNSRLKKERSRLATDKNETTLANISDGSKREVKGHHLFVKKQEAQRIVVKTL